MKPASKILTDILERKCMVLEALLTDRDSSHRFL